MTQKQLSMFTEGEDLPLISQTAQRVTITPFIPKPKPQQPALFPVKCGACLDTGNVGGKRCMCQRGGKV